MARLSGVPRSSRVTLRRATGLDLGSIFAKELAVGMDGGSDYSLSSFRKERTRK